jgi:hypothetical protein
MPDASLSFYLRCFRYWLVFFRHYYFNDGIAAIFRLPFAFRSCGRLQAVIISPDFPATPIIFITISFERYYAISDIAFIVLISPSILFVLSPSDISLSSGFD